MAPPIGGSIALYKDGKATRTLDGGFTYFVRSDGIQDSGGTYWYNIDDSCKIIGLTNIEGSEVPVYSVGDSFTVESAGDILYIIYESELENKLVNLKDLKAFADATQHKIDLLWSGSNNSTFTFSANYDDYDYFVLFPIVSTSAIPLTSIVFKDMLATSATASRNVQVADEAYFYTATLYRSGTTTMGIGNRNASNTNCKMTRIYGVKL